MRKGGIIARHRHTCLTQRLCSLVLQGEAGLEPGNSVLDHSTRRDLRVAGREGTQAEGQSAGPSNVTDMAGDSRCTMEIGCPGATVALTESATNPSPPVTTEAIARAEAAGSQSAAAGRDGDGGTDADGVAMAAASAAERDRGDAEDGMAIDGGPADVAVAEAGAPAAGGDRGDAEDGVNVVRGTPYFGREKSDGATGVCAVRVTEAEGMRDGVGDEGAGRVGAGPHGPDEHADTSRVSGACAPRIGEAAAMQDGVGGVGSARARAAPDGQGEHVDEGGPDCQGAPLPAIWCTPMCLSQCRYAFAVAVQ
jgi:hypothetical protein